MATRKELDAIERLLNCPDLNLDELEYETVEAIEEVRQAFRLIEPKMIPNTTENRIALAAEVVDQMDLKTMARAMADIIETEYEGYTDEEFGEAWNQTFGED